MEGKCQQKRKRTDVTVVFKKEKKELPATWIIYSETGDWDMRDAAQHAAVTEDRRVMQMATSPAGNKAHRHSSTA